MIDILGSRQRELLQLLLENKPGLTVDEISRGLGITRNGVRQHLAGLERDGLVTQGGSRPTGGRPEQLYQIAAKGLELFPRHYSWFAHLLIDSLRQQQGSQQLARLFNEMGAGVGNQLRTKVGLLATGQERVVRLGILMNDLGYGVKSAARNNESLSIEANNCVFHNLAVDYPEVCQFDLALIEAYVGEEVNHQACMIRGDQVCRFCFKSAD